jgi:hypothetical protein
MWGARMLSRERWKKKLALSPLSVDQVEDYERRRALSAKRARSRDRSLTAEAQLERRIHEAVLHDATREQELHVRNLRREKRLLLFQVKQLRALQDVELTNARFLAT